jgi:hypothetical protein
MTDEYMTTYMLLRNMQYIDEFAEKFMQKLIDKSSDTSEISAQMKCEAVEGNNPDFLVHVHHETCYVKFSHVVREKQLMGSFQAFLVIRPTFGSMQLKETAMWEFEFGTNGSGKVGDYYLHCRSENRNDETKYNVLFGIARAVQGALQVP